MSGSDGASSNPRELQALNSDLIALLALPALWPATAGRGRAAIIEILLDVMLSMLRADWMFARLGEPTMTMARVDKRTDGTSLAAVIAERLGDDLSALPAEIDDPCGDGRVRIITSRLPTHGAVIVAASRRDTFPSQRDLLIFRVAVNQAVIGLDAARLIEAERHRGAQLAKLNEAALAIHSEHELAGVLEQVTDHAREIIGAHMALTSLTTDANFVQSIQAVSLTDKYDRYRTYEAKPNGSGIYRIVCERNQAMRLTQAQLEAHPAWRAFGTEAAHHPPLRGWLAVPLIARDGSNLGLIQLSDKYVGDFDDADEHVLQQLAQIASVALENVRLTEDLRRSQVVALEADRRKDEFLALLGHELRNPLAPILTALDLIKLREPAGMQRERETIERHVRHMMRLVDDLLDVSRVTRGKLELRPVRIELASAIAKAVELASPLLEERAHVLDVMVPRDGLDVVGDPIRLTQVFTNLLANAAKYTPPRGRIELRAELSATEIAVTVSDNGLGIAPELLPRLFDMFVQGPQGVDRAQGGLGLGLAIVRMLVELHGGRVSAISDGPGTGSTFRVILPRAGHGALTNERPADTADLPRGAMAVARCVLIVDDNVDARELLGDALEILGYVVHRAGDGTEALALATAHLPELALVDIGLPGMDGYEVARRLRELRGDEIRLFAITGYGQERDRENAARAGFDRHFVKPVDLRALQAALTQSP